MNKLANKNSRVKTFIAWQNRKHTLLTGNQLLLAKQSLKPVASLFYSHNRPLTTLKVDETIHRSLQARNQVGVTGGLGSVHKRSTVCAGVYYLWLYGGRCMSANIHLLLHLTQCVRELGPAHVFTLKVRMVLVHGTRHIEKQLITK